MSTSHESRSVDLCQYNDQDRSTNTNAIEYFPIPLEYWQRYCRATDQEIDNRYVFVQVPHGQYHDLCCWCLDDPVQEYREAIPPKKYGKGYFCAMLEVDDLSKFDGCPRSPVIVDEGHEYLFYPDKLTVGELDEAVKKHADYFDESVCDSRENGIRTIHVTDENVHFFLGDKPLIPSWPVSVYQIGLC